jgi:hypothetical protein
MGDKGGLAYTVNSKLCEYHISDSYIFMSEQAVFTKIVYADMLSDSAEYISLSCSDGGIARIGGGVEIGGIRVESDGEGYTVRLGNSEIVLDDGEIFVNGERFFADSFEWTSEIML